MTREESLELFEQIKANRRRLDAYPKHRFDLGEPPYRFGEKATCQNCGGSMDLTDIGQYARGYAAAGGNPNDVVPNWSK